MLEIPIAMRRLLVNPTVIDVAISLTAIAGAL